MKKLILVFAVIVFTADLIAQSPQKMSYQAVIRNSSEALIKNTMVGIRIQILQGSEFGAAIYIETHTPTTNANGLVSLEIGNGVVVSGVFANIDWASGPYFIKTETDPAGGNNFSIIGTSELLSVPYALYSASGPASPSDINGTVNTLIKFTDTGSGGNSQVTDNGTTVGIAQPTPDAAAKLDVNGQIKISGGNPGTGKVLVSNADGLATWQDVANPKTAFSSKISSSQIIPSGIITFVRFQSEDFDDGNNFTDSVFTAPDAGTYQINSQTTWSTTTATTGFYTLILYVNSALYMENVTPVINGAYNSNNISTVLKLNQGDRVMMAVYQSSGVNQSLVFTIDNRFSGFRIY